MTIDLNHNRQPRYNFLPITDSEICDLRTQQPRTELRKVATMDTSTLR